LASKLIKAGAEINALGYGDTALHLAVWKKNLVVVDPLVTSPSIDINFRNTWTESRFGGSTDLVLAAGYGASVVVHRLIEVGADVNAFNFRGYSALHVAAIKACLETVGILLTAPQIDISVLTRIGEFHGPGASALVLAARMGHVDVVEALVKAGADTVT
jgi:ankyrin repeat protein